MCSLGPLLAYSGVCLASEHELHPQACQCTFTAGGSDAPDLNPVLLNIVINGAGIAGTSWLFRRDLRARQRDRSSVEREEALARLQVRCPSMYAFPPLTTLLFLHCSEH